MGAGPLGRLARRQGGRDRDAGRVPETVDGKVVIKRELLPDGRHKLILKDPATGDYSDVVN